MISEQLLTLKTVIELIDVITIKANDTYQLSMNYVRRAYPVLSKALDNISQEQKIFQKNNYMRVLIALFCMFLINRAYKNGISNYYDIEFFLKHVDEEKVLKFFKIYEPISEKFIMDFLKLWYGMIHGALTGYRLHDVYKGDGMEASKIIRCYGFSHKRLIAFRSLLLFFANPYE